MADTEASPSLGEKLKIYLRTRKGLVLAAEIILSFIAMICYAASVYSGYVSVAICEMVFAIIIFIVFMMELDKQFQIINWLWTDLIRAGIGAVIYLITSLICVSRSGGDGALIAGGVFGLIAGILFAYDSYTIFLEIKSARGRSAVSTDA